MCLQRMEIQMEELIRIIQAWIDRQEADGCEGCEFIKTEMWEMPCKKCKRNHKDYWRAAK